MPAHAYAGVYYPIEDVLQEVGTHKKHRVQYGGAHDDREVLLEDRTHKLLAEARYGEYRLDYQGPRYQGGGEGEHDGDERDHGVPEHVPEDDREPTQALSLGERHVVLTQHLEHLRPREGGYDGGNNGGEHERGQHGVPPALEEGNREDPELQTQPVLRQRREHEVGNRDAEHSQERCPAVPDAVLLEGAHDTEEEPHHQPDDDRLGPQKQ